MTIIINNFCGIRKDGGYRLVERWHGEQTGRWTYHLIPELATWLNRKHGEVGFYLAQALSSHGCFNAYPGPANLMERWWTASN